MKRLLIVLLATLIAGTACGGEAPTPTRGREKIFIGLARNLGDESAVALGVERGVRLAIAEHNADPDSTFEAVLTRVDTKGTAEGAASAGKELAETEFLVGVIGPLTETEILAVAGPLIDAQLPFLIPNVTSTRLPRKGWTGFRRLVAGDRGEGAALGRVAGSEVEGGGVAILHDDGIRSRALATGARAALEEAEIEVVRAGVLEDVAGITVALMREPPGAVIYAGRPDLGGAFVAALREAGYEGVFAASAEARAPAFRERAGGAVDEVLTESVWAPPSWRGSRRFGFAFKDRYDADATPFALEAHEGTLMLTEAAEEVGSRSSSVISFLSTYRRFLGDSKAYDFTESGELSHPPLWIYRFGDGEWQAEGRSDDRADRSRRGETAP